MIVTGFDKYVLFFRIREGAIQIVRLLHGSQDLEAILARRGRRKG